MSISLEERPAKSALNSLKVVRLLPFQSSVSHLNRSAVGPDRGGRAFGTWPRETDQCYGVDSGVLSSSQFVRVSLRWSCVQQCSSLHTVLTKIAGVLGLGRFAWRESSRELHVLC